MLTDLINALSPVNATDCATWHRVQAEQPTAGPIDVFWYPGAGFDFSPLRAKADGRLKNALLIDAPVFYTDLHPSVREELKRAHGMFSEGIHTLGGLKPALTYLHGSDGEVQEMVPLRHTSTEIQEAMFLRVGVGTLVFDLFYFFLPASDVLEQVFQHYGIGLMTVAPLGSWKGGEYLGDIPLSCVIELPDPLRPEFVLTNQTFDHDKLFRKHFKYCSLIRDCSSSKALLYKRIRRHPRASGIPVAPRG